MKYFKFKDKDYCISFRYLDYEAAYDLSVELDELTPEKLARRSEMEQDIQRLFSLELNGKPNKRFPYWKDWGIFDKNGNRVDYQQMYCEVTLSIVGKNDQGKNTYLDIAQSWSRRNLKDPHNKATARKTAIARLLKQDNINGELKKSVHDNCK